MNSLTAAIVTDLLGESYGDLCKIIEVVTYPSIPPVIAAVRRIFWRIDRPDNPHRRDRQD